MKKIISIILFVMCEKLLACNSYIIGFRGVNGQFDNRTFIEYAYHHDMCWTILNANEVSVSLRVIKQLDKPYELYGFSLGAESVRQVLSNVKSKGLKKPNHVITIGAYHTTNVDFTKYDVSFINYFDESGRNQKSPGIYIPKVSHSEIQKYVDKRIR
jgi:hypothetical protein